jgi:hypothetical protein
MLLKEMFSPVGAPKNDENQDIDWMDDLKFFIDNDDTMLNQYFFPAVKKHKEYAGNPNAYKIYVKPIENCLGHYCKKFNVERPEEKFPKEKLIDLAKTFAEEQEKFIKNGDYES